MNNYHKYPKSKSGNQCLGPCTKPGEFVLHPISLDYITEPNVQFCPIEYKEDLKNPGSFITVEECYNLSDNNQEQNLDLNILFPKVQFDCAYFLKLYYKIYSFESAFEWVKNNNSPSRTNKRIINCAWRSYGSNIDIITNSVTEYYIDLIKRKWIKKWYNYLEKYIKIDKNKIYFIKPIDKKIDNENRVHKINFIIKKIINKNNIYKFLQKYIKENKENWDKIIDHNNNLSNNFINYIKNKIDLSLK
jgi:hypothetical protein